MVKSACGIEAVYMCFNGTGIWGGETILYKCFVFVGRRISLYCSARVKYRRPILFSVDSIVANLSQLKGYIRPISQLNRAIFL